MFPEDKCHLANRFLYAETFLSDKTIKKWQKRAIQRCLDKKKMEIPYQQFINWRRQQNEVAVFTSYAYADFSIPKKYNCIFDFSNPEKYTQISYTISQSIWEGWFPVDFIEGGHKHLCILQFDQNPAELFIQLAEEEEYIKNPRIRNPLGLCEYNTLNALIQERIRVAELKELYGDKWEEHDGV